MVAYRFLTLISLGLGSHCASALQYGYNQVSTHKDSAVVAGAFPAINGTHLQSPAFTSPGTVPRGFSDGTSGPTRDETMGEFCLPLLDSPIVQLLMGIRGLHAPPGKVEQLDDLP